MKIKGLEDLDCFQDQVKDILKTTNQTDTFE